jgi:hypothetical protein
LGHLVGKDGIRVDSKNIAAMQDWLNPKTLKSLHGFLGLTGYYCKFVKNYERLQHLSVLFSKRTLLLGLQPLLKISKP